MTNLDDREKALESKFAHDEELTFKAAARRNTLLAHWAGKAIGYSDEECNAFADELVKFDLSENGYEDVYTKLRETFDGSHVEMSEHRIRKAMDENMSIARKQVLEG